MVVRTEALTPQELLSDPRRQALRRAKAGCAPSSETRNSPPKSESAGLASSSGTAEHAGFVVFGNKAFPHQAGSLSPRCPGALRRVSPQPGRVSLAFKTLIAPDLRPFGVRPHHRTAPPATSRRLIRFQLFQRYRHDPLLKANLAAEFHIELGGVDFHDLQFRYGRQRGRQFGWRRGFRRMVVFSQPIYIAPDLLDSQASDPVRQLINRPSQGRQIRGVHECFPSVRRGVAVRRHIVMLQADRRTCACDAGVLMVDGARSCAVAHRGRPGARVAPPPPENLRRRTRGKTPARQTACRYAAEFIMG